MTSTHLGPRFGGSPNEGTPWSRPAGTEMSLVLRDDDELALLAGAARRREPMTGWPSGTAQPASRSTIASLGDFERAVPQCTTTSPSIAFCPFAKVMLPSGPSSTTTWSPG